jgi:hypothetical protein
MKNKIILTESDLIELIKKAINEQHEDEDINSFEEHMETLEFIANHFNEETTEEQLEFMISQMQYELDSAERSGELSDEELEELKDFASDLAREMEEEFYGDMDLMEGTKAKKPKPMKSRKSGLKTMARIKKNHEVLKKFNQQ